ncbi:MAG: TRAP transporter small permease subunit [bacterium]
MKKIGTFADRAIWIFETSFLTVAIAVMVATLFAQVAFGMLGISLAWAGELALYLMVWIMCIGASAAVRSRSHIAVGLIADKLTGLPARIVRVAVLLFCFFLCVGAFILGVKYVQMTYAAGLRSVAARLPMWTVYAALPVASALMAARVILLAARGLAIRARKGEKEPEL